MTDQEVDLLADTSAEQSNANASAAEIVLAAASQQEDGEINTSNEQDNSDLLDQSGDIPAITTTAPVIHTENNEPVAQVTPASNQNELANENGEENAVPIVPTESSTVVFWKKLERHNY